MACCLSPWNGEVLKAGRLERYQGSLGISLLWGSHYGLLSVWLSLTIVQPWARPMFPSASYVGDNSYLRKCLCSPTSSFTSRTWRVAKLQVGNQPLSWSLPRDNLKMRYRTDLDACFRDILHLCHPDKGLLHPKLSHLALRPIL